MWVRTEYDPINPPPLRKRSGRPKKNRRKGEDEPKKSIGVRKHYTTLKCGKCKQAGHNTRTCSIVVNNNKGGLLEEEVHKVVVVEEEEKGWQIQGWQSKGCKHW
ncbi:hypothetical protein Vadar_033579 [Vaccinium darrowii]|uniref:Uncharacterized protein n=1 Tax=Vaccinium darrowii TaxID=229202 RepID=A0ACB7Y3E5_9ERIC|nr:hypothetical protein Vadar_033579 [Vaccinium darrowii]